MSEDSSNCNSPLRKRRRTEGGSMTESLSGGGGDNASQCKHVDLPVYLYQGMVGTFNHMK